VITDLVGYQWINSSPLKDAGIGERRQSRTTRYVDEHNMAKGSMNPFDVSEHASVSGEGIDENTNSVMEFKTLLFR
jgi:hypothetical protein